MLPLPRNELFGTNMNALQPYTSYILAFVGSLIVSLLSVPNIIYIAKRKRLLDMPDNHRKLHVRIVPNLGGIGIFFAFFIVAALLIEPLNFPKWNYIAAASLILFITGLKDDLVAISPSKKFIAQAIAATITVVFADVRLHSLGGLFGVHNLPDWVSIPFSIVGCIFVTNAFNLVDGIDGLAGSIGVYITTMLGLFLAGYGKVSEAVLAFSMTGALIGFLRYNLAPAKIFMGDTGSLIIGFIVSVLGILTINTYHPGGSIDAVIIATPRGVDSISPGVFIVTLAILFIPVFDTFRVFTMRILRGHSPFHADRTHLHHYLLDLGLSHTKTVSVILVANVAVTGLALWMQHYNINIAVATMLFFMLGLYAILVYLRRSHMQLQSRPHHMALPKRHKQKSVTINNSIKVPNTVMVGGKVVHLKEEELMLTEIGSN
jgi:UDP-N-acetylmuramyl pentapeptide phosphotransferase/UDP-N-acetylglucosamine-1-phosphate transferase